MTQEIVFTQYQAAVEKAAMKLEGRSKPCATNAFKRIRQGWKLRHIDPELAAFSAITAHEEAATALIFALKNRKYLGASDINPRSHPDKSGLIFMIELICKLFVDLNIPPVTWIVRTTLPTARIDIKMEGILWGLPDGIAASPNEPLNIIPSKSGDAPEDFDLSDQVNEFLVKNNSKTFLNFIKDEAEKRNDLLYANDEGVPSVACSDEYFYQHLGRVVILVGAAILILQSNEPQPLAQQLVKIYLGEIKKAKETK